MTADPNLTPERLNGIERAAKAHCYTFPREALALVAMARECLRWRTMGESPEAVRRQLAEDMAHRGGTVRLVAERDKLLAEVQRLRKVADRDPLCWPCFKDRNEADGKEPHAERDDCYVSCCNQCGHDQE